MQTVFFVFGCYYYIIFCYSTFSRVNLHEICSAYIHEWVLSKGNRFVDTCSLLDALHTHSFRDVQAICLDILCYSTINKVMYTQKFTTNLMKFFGLYWFPLTWHSFGSSLTAFSTARLRDAVDLEISTRQFGQVAIWSRSLW